MKPGYEKELRELNKLERFQAFVIRFITKIGKWLHFLLPFMLIGITVLAILALVDLVVISTRLIGIFFVILALYTVNSIILYLGAARTNKLLETRLEFERKRGRPIDALDGFDELTHHVKRVIKLLKVTAILSIIATLLFAAMVVLRLIELGYAAIGFTLFALGLALLIRSLNLNIYDVNGLKDFYKPTNHQIFLDNLFSDVVSNHIDPITLLRWNDYILGISEILNPAFIKKVKSLEKGERPITFAIEKILYLYYLKSQGVLEEERFLAELKEVINIKSKTFDVDKGLLIEGKWYFSRKDILSLFEYIKEHNPGIFKIIDRLQIELRDNIEMFSQDKIYMDSFAHESVFKGQSLNVMVYLFNNSPKSKEYRIRVIATGFAPGEFKLDMRVEGRGSFKIPEEPIPLTSSSGTDIVGVMSDMLENGDSLWLTLEPRVLGEQSIQIFLETADGTIIEGRTRNVRVAKDFKSQLKKLTSIGSILGGIAAPISRALIVT